MGVSKKVHPPPRPATTLPVKKRPLASPSPKSTNVHAPKSEIDRRLFVAQLASKIGNHQHAIDALTPVLPFCLIPPLKSDRVQGLQDCSSAEARNILTIAYKNLTNSLRTSWRIYYLHGASLCGARQLRPTGAPLGDGFDNDDLQSPTGQSVNRRRMNLAYRATRHVEKELRDLCNDVLRLSNQVIKLLELRGKECVEDLVFWLKMKADYLRYLIEISRASQALFGETTNTEAIGKFQQEAFELYRKAFQLANDDDAIDILHSTRLGIGLNFAVFYHDIKKCPVSAMYIAKFVFDKALDTIICRSRSATEESIITDALLILDIMRDNLVIWRDAVE